MVGNPAFAPTGLFSSLRKYVRVSNLSMFTGGQGNGGTNELPKLILVSTGGGVIF